MANKKSKKKASRPETTEEIVAAVEELAPEFAAPDQPTESIAHVEVDQDATNAPEKSFAARHKSVLAAIGGAAATLVLLGGIALSVSTMQHQDRITAMEASQEVIAAQAAEHVHTWIPQTETHHIDAVTETVFHPAVYEDVVVNHTLCNVCNTVIDGVAEEHKADTGHSYTVNVPISESHLKSAEWTETVVVEDARDETVTVGVLCTSCGEQLNTTQAEAQGIAVPDADAQASE